MTKQELMENLREELGHEIDSITVEEFALKMGYAFNQNTNQYELVTEV